jgi:hypothetical protein
MSILGAAVFVAPLAFAQDDDFFIEEPPEFEEPEEYDIPPPPPSDDPDYSGSPPGFIPPPVRNSGAGAVRPRLGGTRSSDGQDRLGRTEGAIEFRLADPPQYWKKKPRPTMPSPKAY